MKHIHILLSALALGAMTTFVLAQPTTQTDAQSAPVKLTAAQMDRIVAGDNPHTKHNETGNPHGVNPGGNTGGCPSNPNCTPSTGNPH